MPKPNARPTLRVILVTAPPGEAETIAMRLLEERLIACANLLPGVTSLYWWDAKINRDGETLMLLKTPKRNLPALLKRLKELHSYSVPEFVALPVDFGNPAYLDWAAKEATPARKPKRKSK